MSLGRANGHHIRCTIEIAENHDALYSLLGYLCYAFLKTIDTLMNSDGNTQWPFRNTTHQTTHLEPALPPSLTSSSRILLKRNEMGCLHPTFDVLIQDAC